MRLNIFYCSLADSAVFFLRYNFFPSIVLEEIILDYFDRYDGEIYDGKLIFFSLETYKINLDHLDRSD